MPDGKRLWRTADGHLVEDGHPDAVTLAYGVADELREDEKAAPPKPATKAAKKTADKQAVKTEDK